MKILTCKFINATKTSQGAALLASLSSINNSSNQFHTSNKLEFIYNVKNNHKNLHANKNLILNNRRNIRYGNLGGKINTSGATLLLSPAEATKILRAHEATVDLEEKCSIKYYDVNYLGSNNPPEDRQTQAKYLHSDIYLFGVFDGHGGKNESLIFKTLNFKFLSFFDKKIRLLLF
jgi:hypothetical protein